MNDEKGIYQIGYLYIDFDHWYETKSVLYTDFETAKAIAMELSKTEESKDSLLTLWVDGEIVEEYNYENGKEVSKTIREE